jgi:hypothetical protein
MQCLKCGTQNNTDASFCRACGNKLQEPPKILTNPTTPSAASLPKETPAANTKGVNSRLLLGLLSVAALFGVVGGGAYWYYQRIAQVEGPDLKVGDRWVYVSNVSNNHSIESNRDMKLTERFEYQVTGANGDDIELTKTTLDSTVEFNGKSNQQHPRPSNGKADRSTWALQFPSAPVIAGTSVPFAFPLKIGKTWEYSFTTQLGPNQLTRNLTAKVEGWEEIQVPAGKFKTLKIVRSGTLVVSTPDGKSHPISLSQIAWYAPNVRRYVKFEEHWEDESNGGRHWGDETLAEYQLK